MRFTLSLVLFAAMTAAQAKSEAEYAAEWCGLHDMVYDVPGDGKRPSELIYQTPSGREVYADCASSRAVVEVDFARKYMEGIGQALMYGRLSKLEPILLLIIETPDDCRYFWDAWWLIWESNQRMQLASTGHSCRE